MKTSIWGPLCGPLGLLRAVSATVLLLQKGTRANGRLYSLSSYRAFIESLQGRTVRVLVQYYSTVVLQYLYSTRAVLVQYQYSTSTVLVQYPVLVGFLQVSSTTSASDSASTSTTTSTSTSARSRHNAPVVQLTYNFINFECLRHPVRANPCQQCVACVVLQYLL